jgi:hypothetical protein
LRQSGNEAPVSVQRLPIFEPWGAKHEEEAWYLMHLKEGYEVQKQTDQARRAAQQLTDGSSNIQR